MACSNLLRLKKPSETGEEQSQEHDALQREQLSASTLEIERPTTPLIEDDNTSELFTLDLH
jgi:hypothetical protein